MGKNTEVPTSLLAHIRKKHNVVSTTFRKLWNCGKTAERHCESARRPRWTHQKLLITPNWSVATAHSYSDWLHTAVMTDVCSLQCSPPTPPAVHRTFINPKWLASAPPPTETTLHVTLTTTLFIHIHLSLLDTLCCLLTFDDCNMDTTEKMYRNRSNQRSQTSAENGAATWQMRRT